VDADLEESVSPSVPLAGATVNVTGARSKMVPSALDKTRVWVLL